jgi:molybdate transport system regulatory protein
MEVSAQASAQMIRVTEDVEILLPLIMTRPARMLTCSNAVPANAAAHGPRLARERRGVAIPMKISARNNIRGTIKSVTAGAVNTEVVIEVAKGVELTSVITKASAERLGLRAGMSAYAVIKASDVMIGVDD